MWQSRSTVAVNIGVVFIALLVVAVLVIDSFQAQSSNEADTTPQPVDQMGAMAAATSTIAAPATPPDPQVGAPAAPPRAATRGFDPSVLGIAPTPAGGKSAGLASAHEVHAGSSPSPPPSSVKPQLAMRPNPTATQVSDPTPAPVQRAATGTAPVMTPGFVAATTPGPALTPHPASSAARLTTPPTRLPMPTEAVSTPAGPATTNVAAFSPVAVAQRTAAAETSLRSGHFEIRIFFSDGSTSSATLEFDVGDVRTPSRYRMITRYPGVDATDITELISIGDQSWQRRSNGPWRMTSGAEGAWGQVQAFLAHAGMAVDPQFDPTTPGVLRWYDAARGAVITLRVDPATGVPKEMRQLTRATGTAMVVTYSGWNSLVSIVGPGG